MGLPSSSHIRTAIARNRGEAISNPMTENSISVLRLIIRTQPRAAIQAEFYPRSGQRRNLALRGTAENRFGTREIAVKGKVGGEFSRPQLQNQRTKDVL